MDLRPVANVIGKLVAAMGLAMLAPLIVDAARGDPHWQAFLGAMVVTVLAGVLLTVATQGGEKSLNLRQSFVLTTGVWLVLPAVGALPFVLGAPYVSPTDAYFEAMSGLTTTGATAFPALDVLPWGTNLWRAILQWLGGLGILVVALIFLPVMRVGGMQFFKSEGFDTLGKILPRAMDISSEMTRIYVVLTVACGFTYLALGMTPFDALIHALTTMSTGGFSNHDASFAGFIGPNEYAAALFMVLASAPFIRFVQVLKGDPLPLWRDVQLRAYLRWIGYAVAIITAYRLIRHEDAFWPTLREAVFNVTSSFSGTGFVSADVLAWGQLSFVVMIVVGLIGGCTNSTGCSVKVFRYQILFQAVRSQIGRMHSPHRILPVRYDGQVVQASVIDSVMAFVSIFFLTFGLLIVALSLVGLDPFTAFVAAWTSIANVGLIWGPGLTANGSVADFPVAAKWLMILGMFLGRLELLSVLVLLLPRFWRD
ncbi:TrkH family potassium uptake protein [Paracoccus sp. p4-l81]|uniref:TrkH family potassium uptake protein n=1 Tax=unclassified Paracoccus (in: a-proteobacteria) TaxID=2688777 RepID=UPI0035B70AC3